MITIEDARPEDAPVIGLAIMEAIGPEIAADLASDKLTLQELHELFTRLAAREDSQYSYKNSRIARTEDGCVAGVCVSYDGADLKRLRRPFFLEAIRNLGWKLSEKEMEEFPAETEADEYYLDSLMTIPEFRGKGIARALILDAKAKAEKSGKPLGLLCERDNTNARRLYDSVGFIEIGKRPFAGTTMNHLQLPTGLR